MASTDARPVPLKNTAYRVYFPIMDADGDLVTGAAGLDSEVSIDGGTFADCTNEATEIATSSGMYFLDLTSAEMNGDAICIIVKTSTNGAKTTPIVLYPAESTDIPVDVTAVLSAIAALNNLSAAQVNAEADAALADYDPPTNSELVTALASADDATLAAIAALSIPTAADVWDNPTRTLTSGGGSGGATAEEIWEYENRTLTQTAAQVASAVSGSDLTITRAVTFSATLTGLTIPVDRDSLYFTVKRSLGSADTEAIVQIEETDGLLRINKAAATANQGSLVVDDDTVTITIADDATVLLLPYREYQYDIKAIADGISTVLTQGTVTVVSTPTATV